MKIAFIGSHGTGKTTLCFRLAAHLKQLDRHVDLVKEVARRSPLPLNRDTSRDAQRWILHTQIASEIQSSASHDVVICDRAVIDNYAYLVHAAGRDATLETLVREWMKTYTALFRVPIVIEPRYDGVRDLSPTFQRDIDDLVEALIEAFGVRCTSLSREAPDTWLETILSTLELPLTPPQMPLFGSADPTEPR